MNYPVGYLEVTDFNQDGCLKGELANKPVMIMIQSGGCGHCHRAIPDFQKFADSKPPVFVATIQADGERDSERALQPLLPKICPGFVGFPSYVLHQGKDKTVHTGGRSKESLDEFVRTRLKKLST